MKADLTKTSFPSSSRALARPMVYSNAHIVISRCVSSSNLLKNYLNYSHLFSDSVILAKLLAIGDLGLFMAIKKMMELAKT